MRLVSVDVKPIIFNYSFLLQVRKVNTPYGEFTVTIVGDSRSAILVTVHDIALNHNSNFHQFFNEPDMRILMNNFCIVHIDMPGQESGAKALPEGPSTYPTMTELVSGVKYVLAQHGISYFMGLGYGAGAFVLSLLALENPELVSGLVLINANSEAASWADQAYIRTYTTLLTASGFNRGVQEYLRWYHCGRDGVGLPNVLQRFEERILNQNPRNLSGWMEAYSKRPSLGLQRRTSCLETDKRNFRCPVLLAVGQESPHLEETRRMFSQCDPDVVSILELAHCRAPLDECPVKVRLM